jgi:hypothetical protein
MRVVRIVQETPRRLTYAWLSGYNCPFLVAFLLNSFLCGGARRDTPAATERCCAPQKSAENQDLDRYTYRIPLRRCQSLRLRHWTVDNGHTIDLIAFYATNGVYTLLVDLVPPFVAFAPVCLAKWRSRRSAHRYTGTNIVLEQVLTFRSGGVILGKTCRR